MKGKVGLGRGLGALLSREEIMEAESPGFFNCPIEKVRPNPDQPRRAMEKEALASLAESIKERGVLQPLVVRQGEGSYELIAGERRWRAAQIAGLKTVPVVIKDVSPGEVLELALVENIQRQDLNPLEEAMAYKRLVDEFGLSQQEVSRRVGRERSTVANFLRLLNLPAYAQEDVTEGRITTGHARALLMVSDPLLQKELRDAIIKEGLSVRQAERRARRLESGARGAGSRKEQDPDILNLCEELSVRLGARVRIFHGKKGGRLEIKYESVEGLERLLELLRR